MRLVLAVLCVAVVHCGDDSAPSAPTCEELGCPALSTCDQGACLADEPQDYRIAVRFVPPDDPAAAEWNSVALVSEHEGLFLFHDRLRVRGQVLREGEPMPAYVELSRVSPVPSREPIVVAQSIHADESFDFSVPATDRCPHRLCAYDYVLTAWSTDGDDPFPPTRVHLSEVEVGSRFDVVVRPTVTIKGTVTSGIGPGAQRIPNLRVLAIDPATGDPISQSAITSDLAGDTGGDFRLSIPESTDAFTLRFAENDLNPARSLPTIESAPLSLPTLSLDPEDDAYVVPLSVCIYPPTSQITLSGTVEGLPRAGGRVPVGGATLRFTSDDLGLQDVADVAGHLEKVTRSLADGAYEVPLAAGTYTVEVRPPAANELADLAAGVLRERPGAPPPDDGTPVDPEPAVRLFVNGPDFSAQSGPVLQVSARVALAGTVEDAFGRRLDGARVDLHGGSDLADRIVGRTEPAIRNVYAHTTAEGAFLALVDSGHFDVVVRPQPESLLPWAIRLGIPVTVDTTLPASIVVAPGRRLSGNVTIDVAPDEIVEPEPAPGVEVEVWCLPPEEGGPDDTDDDVAIICGRTTTDAAGRYSLLLPAALEIFPVAAD